MVIHKIDTINKIYIAFLIILIFAIIYSFFDHTHWNGIDVNDEANNYYKRIFNRLYYSMVTWSTIGYGDITPKSVIVRFIFMIQVVILLLLAFVW